MSVYIGIDWSENKHDIVFINEEASILARFTIAHSAQGFAKFDATRQRLGFRLEECLVALETAHNVLIDFLWARGYREVYVVPPRVTKSRRPAYSLANAHTDQSDAYLLADLLRYDRHRLSPWRPDLVLTREMRAKVSLLLHLTKSSVRLSNRLRAVLLRYYPAALQVFSRLNAPITLAFIRSFPTPKAAAALSFDAFQAFARQHRYSQPRKLLAAFARLQTPQPCADPDIVYIYQQEALLLATLLLQAVEAKKMTLKALRDLFVQHPDYAIFDSLPGAGELLAPALLVKFGDDRQRFPSAASVQALAGTCPVTEESGKRRYVKFRHACDREFRYIATQWARHSLDQSVWANTYYHRVLPRARSKSHAQRCLANRWLAILWKLWQSRQPYDEAYHLQQCKLRSKPKVIFVE
jgi:transposase